MSHPVFCVLKWTFLLFEDVCVSSCYRRVWPFVLVCICIFVFCISFLYFAMDFPIIWIFFNLLLEGPASPFAGERDTHMVTWNHVKVNIWYLLSIVWYLIINIQYFKFGIQQYIILNKDRHSHCYQKTCNGK